MAKVLPDQEGAYAQPLEFYAEESGLDLETVERLAREFTAHGKKAAIDFYRGPIKVTDGYYAAQMPGGIRVEVLPAPSGARPPIWRSGHENTAS